MTVEILPSAKRDLQRGFRFHERQEEGIGDCFLDSDTDGISIFAGAHRLRGDFFRFKSKRFPY